MPRHWPRHALRKQHWSKYHAVPVVYEGHRFASKAEGRYYLYLRSLEQGGEIATLSLQPRFELQRRPHRIVYVADFQVTYPNGHTEVIDVKGVQTPAFRLKQKLYEAHQPALPPLRIVAG